MVDGGSGDRVLVVGYSPKLSRHCLRMVRLALVVLSPRYPRC